MKIPSIELGNISRFRAEQMGAAMLFVILFHVALDRGDPFYGLRRCGNVGVDIFLFLSGVGLWFAWTKTPSVNHFYRRRLIRILPTWLICSTAFYLRDYLGARRFSRTSSTSSAISPSTGTSGCTTNLHSGTCPQ